MNIVLDMEVADVPAFDGEGPPVIRGVSWRVLHGEFHVVGGLPGSGKSALLAAAAGLMRVAQGRVCLFGDETEARPESELVALRRRVGFVFSDGGRLFHQMTLSENVSLPMRYHECLEADAREERVRGILQATGLSEWASVTPGRLGRPQRARAGLARALALEPEFLLLDHPAVGLDPREVRWWGDMLRALSQGHPELGGQPTTLVLATEDLRPWLEEGRHYSYVEAAKFTRVGGVDALRSAENPVLREMLTGE